MSFLLEGQGEGEVVLELRLLVDQGLVERILDKVKEELKRLPGTTARAFPRCAPQVNHRMLRPRCNAGMWPFKLGFQLLLLKPVIPGR